MHPSMCCVVDPGVYCVVDPGVYCAVNPGTLIFTNMLIYARESIIIVNNY